MRRLSDSIAGLARPWRASGGPPHRPTGRLLPLEAFGDNPGSLAAWFHLPEGAAKSRALVVVLHGCTQDALSYDHGSGWSALADKLGFAVLYPEQRRANNMNLCFSWYEPGDSRRGGGEPLSIAQMIEAMAQRHGIDPYRVYVTGLSAGGAMAAVMLATYPEVFAGGAIIAGLPYGSASSVPRALECMRGHGIPDAAALAGAVLAAAPQPGRRPSISIWHGSADYVVTPNNADASLSQWQSVHGLAGPADTVETIAGHVHRSWNDASGTPIVEDYRIAGMGHGTPLDTLGPQPCGAAGPHMLEAGISSTRRLANFWGLDATASHATALAPMPPPPAPGPFAAAQVVPVVPVRAIKAAPVEAPAAARASGIGRIIEDALRGAGLMR